MDKIPDQNKQKTPLCRQKWEKHVLTRNTQEAGSTKLSYDTEIPHTKGGSVQVQRVGGEKHLLLTAAAQVKMSSVWSSLVVVSSVTSQSASLPVAEWVSSYNLGRRHEGWVESRHKLLLGLNVFVCVCVCVTLVTDMVTRAGSTAACHLLAMK